MTPSPIIDAPDERFENFTGQQAADRSGEFLRASHTTAVSSGSWTDTLLVVGVTLFVTAWFVRVYDGGSTLGTGTLPGWEALRKAWGNQGMSFSRLSALTNVIVLLIPVVLRYTRKRRLVLLLAAALFLAFLVNLQRLVGLFASARAGYYAWCVSFVVLGCAVLMKGISRPVPSREPWDAVLPETPSAREESLI